MNYIDTCQQYEHDIIGSFKIVSSLFESVKKNGLQNEDSQEILHAIHDLLVNMVVTSRNTIIESSLEPVTISVDPLVIPPNSSLVKLNSVVVRSIVSKGLASYYYQTKENSEETSFNLQLLKEFLPINEKTSLAQTKNEQI
jgi:hypothetical protein